MQTAQIGAQKPLADGAGHTLIVAPPAVVYCGSSKVFFATMRSDCACADAAASVSVMPTAIFTNNVMRGAPLRLG